MCLERRNLVHGAVGRIVRLMHPFIRAQVSVALLRTLDSLPGQVIYESGKLHSPLRTMISARSPVASALSRAA